MIQNNRTEFLHNTWLKNTDKIYPPVGNMIPAGTVMLAKEWEKILVFHIDPNDNTIFEKANKP